MNCVCVCYCLCVEGGNETSSVGVLALEHGSRGGSIAECIAHWLPIALSSFLVHALVFEEWVMSEAKKMGEQVSGSFTHNFFYPFFQQFPFSSPFFQLHLLDGHQ